MICFTKCRIARWETTSTLAHNERIMGAVEEAMRKPNDDTKEHMFLPKVGAVFPSLGDAYQFYNLYSWEVGFSIRKATNQYGKKEADGTKPINMQEYRCQRAVRDFFWSHLDKRYVDKWFTVIWN